MTEPGVDERLATVLSGLAREAAPRLLAEAFDDAYDEARSILRQLMVDALLREAGGLRNGHHGSESLAEPARDQTGAATGSVDGGVYVYGFALGDSGPRAHPSGLHGLPTSTITHHQVVAIFSEDSGASLDWGSGGAGTPDLAAVGERAQEHERVLQAILDTGPVIPMRFGTVYPSREALLETLCAHYPAIHAALVALDGKAEWGLTVTCNRNPPTCNRNPPDRADGETYHRFREEAAGRAYLVRREAERVAAERSAAHRREVAGALHRAIDVVATGSVVHPSRRPTGSSERDLDVLLRASYLVDQANHEHFKQAIVDSLEGAADLGLAGELTGPWPPYNFSRLELDGAPA